MLGFLKGIAMIAAVAAVALAGVLLISVPVVDQFVVGLFGGDRSTTQAIAAIITGGGAAGMAIFAMNVRDPVSAFIGFAGIVLVSVGTITLSDPYWLVKDFGPEGAQLAFALCLLISVPLFGRFGSPNQQSTPTPA